MGRTSKARRKARHSRASTSNTATRSTTYTDFNVARVPVIPEGNVASEEHGFRIETVASGLDPLPYSIAPLPDGRILLTEKTRGLSIISPSGEQSELIRGTPQAFDDGFEMPGVLLVFGMGYSLDIALHPDYAENGWIYLSYTDRCTACNTASRLSNRPATMNALTRGRIRDGEWMDQEPIWRADAEHYTSIPDMAAGGRIAFDDAGHVFMTVGIKGASEADGIQDLGKPYGKILRLNDDGSIPAGNPFRDFAGDAAEHLDLRSSQPAGPRIQCRDWAALGHRDGSARRRRGQSDSAR